MGVASKVGQQFKAEFAGRVIATISSAVLTVVLARLLDPDAYGLLFLAISVYGVVKLFSKLGIGRAAGRYLTEYRETDPGQIPHILRISFLCNVLTIGLIGLVLAVGHESIASLIGEPALAPLIAVGVLFVAFGTLVTYIRLVFQGFEEIRLASAVHASDRVCRLVFATGFVLIGYGVTGALWGYILSSALVSIGGLALLYTAFYRGVERSDVESNLGRRIIKYTAPLTATNAANVLDKQVDTILIGFFLNPVAVAYYTAGKQVVQFVKMPMASMGFTLSPLYGSQKASGNSDTAARIYETSLSYGLLLYVPIGTGLMLVAEPLVDLVFGDQYRGAIPVLQVFALYAVLQSITELTNTSLDYLGRAKARAVVQVVTSLLNVILNIILIPLVGVIGAAIATVITHSLYTLANVYIIHVELGLRVRLVLRYVAYSVVIAAAMCIPVYVALDFTTGFVSLFVAVLLGVTVWATLIEFTGLLDIRKIISTLA